MNGEADVKETRHLRPAGIIKLKAPPKSILATSSNTPEPKTNSK